MEVPRSTFWETGPPSSTQEGWGAPAKPCGSVDIRNERLPSSHFDAERTVTVILPDSYGTGRRRYPVLYLHDGSSDWLRRGRLRSVLEPLVREGRIPELIVVMPEPADRTREYKLSAAHVAFMVNELVPWTDGCFRTRPRPAARAVHGVSLGGLVAIWLGLKAPHVFGAAGGQGGAYWYRSRRVVRAAAGDARVATRFFLACGAGDGNLPDNRALAQAMADAGLRYHYEEVAGRHSWSCWRRTLPIALEYYFG